MTILLWCYTTESTGSDKPSRPQSEIGTAKSGNQEVREGVRLLIETYKADPPNLDNGGSINQDRTLTVLAES